MLSYVRVFNICLRYRIYKKGRVKNLIISKLLSMKYKCLDNMIEVFKNFDNYLKFIDVLKIKKFFQCKKKLR